MARCEGTTRSGDQCKREARPDSRFCYVHAPEVEEDGDNETVDWGDLVPLLLAGAMAAGFVLVLRSFGKWIPKF